MSLESSPFDENFIPLRPIGFFQIGFSSPYIPFKNWEESIKKKQYQIPDTSLLCHQTPFANLHMGWNEEGLCFKIQVDQKPRHIYFPDIQQGDSIEIFIDTRDMKTSGYNTRFCHHFFVLPEAVEGHQLGERTHFRTEDKHPLCDPAELQLKLQNTKTGYLAYLFIPASCLHGYDPEQFSRLGFTYRINRYHDTPQCFSASSDEYPIEQQPSLWSSVQLT